MILMHDLALITIKLGNMNMKYNDEQSAQAAKLFQYWSGLLAYFLVLSHEKLNFTSGGSNKVFTFQPPRPCFVVNKKN